MALQGPNTGRLIHSSNGAGCDDDGATAQIGPDTGGCRFARSLQQFPDGSSDWPRPLHSGSLPVHCSILPLGSKYCIINDCLRK